jgi:hypothetical protein
MHWICCSVRSDPEYIWTRFRFLPSHFEPEWIPTSEVGTKYPRRDAPVPRHPHATAPGRKGWRREVSMWRREVTTWRREATATTTTTTAAFSPVLRCLPLFSPPTLGLTVATAAAAGELSMPPAHWVPPPLRNLLWSAARSCLREGVRGGGLREGKCWRPVDLV